MLRRWTVPLAAAVVAVFSVAAPRALVGPLTRADIERAQRIARGSPAGRARFHQQYVLPSSDPTIGQVELLTEFRRLVLLTEEHMQRGDWMFSQGTRAAEEAIRPTKGLVQIKVNLRFHPQNTLTTVPAYELALGLASAGTALNALETQTTPQYSLQSAAGKTWLVGATLQAEVMAESIGQTTRAVGVLLDGKEAARFTVDFARLD